MPILSLWLNFRWAEKTRGGIGRHFDLHAFAREAFVFIVNADNPVNSLTDNKCVTSSVVQLPTGARLAVRSGDPDLATPGRLW